MNRASYDDSNDLIVISGFVPYALPWLNQVWLNCLLSLALALSEPSIAKLAAF